MPESALRLIRRCTGIVPKELIKTMPSGLRGFYVLYQRQAPRRKDENEKFNVMYVGMATARGRRGGLRRRLISHSNSKRKRDLWDYFSAFQVWDNIRDDEVRELEGLFRHIYRKDAAANRLNIQKSFKKLRLPEVRENDLEKWKET